MHEIDKELVSVIVPSFNRGCFVKRCFFSVCSQKHRPLEFILIDDASTDDTEEVFRQLPPSPEIDLIYFKQPKNMGVSAARNLGIQNSKGKFIAFLDSDDVWFDCHLEKLLDVLSDTKIDIAYARGDIRESPSSPSSGRSSFGPTYHEESHLRECIYYYNFVLPSATMVRRSFFDCVGYFDTAPEIQHAEDWDIFIRAAEKKLKFQHVRETTVYYTTPKEIADSKKRMMVSRGLYCLEKNISYHHTAKFNKNFTLTYYTLNLALLFGIESVESRKLFKKLLLENKVSIVAFLISCLGLLRSISPKFVGLNIDRVIYKLFRKLRAKHRHLRGFENPWD